MKRQIAVFGGGCFWGVEARFSCLKGVISAASGYAGGWQDRPNYEDVSSGKTGHAEVVMVDYDPGVISYEILLDVFFHTHDPTTLNRQGADIGTNYRSIILYTGAEQKEKAEDYIRKLSAEKTFKDPIVTEVKPLGKFYKAEEYHQRYFAKNRGENVCHSPFTPKMEEFAQKYKNLLKG